MKKSLVAAAAALAIGFSAPAYALNTYSFDNITANSVADAAIGEAQLFVDVSDTGTGQVAFTFRNIGPAASSITDIYFDDGTLLDIATITNMSGVDFSEGASPGNLPGGIGGFTAAFSADSEPPTQPNGVNPGEQVTITFDLFSGKTYADTIAALEDNTLRIGIHVQGFASGGSESFENNGGGGGSQDVPEPGTLLLLGSGLVGLGLMRRRKTQR